MRRKRTVVVHGLPKFYPCANCSKDGWTTTVVRGVRRVTRCHCWQQFQEQIAAVQALAKGQAAER